MQRPKSGASRRHRLALVPGYRPETGQSPSPAQTPRLELYAFAAPASCAEAVTVPPRKPHWRRCRRLKWSLGYWNCRQRVSAARRPGCCAAHRWTEAITRFLVLWAVVLILVRFQDETNDPGPSGQTSQRLGICRHPREASFKLTDDCLH